MLSILIHRIVDLLQQDVGLHGFGNIVCCSRLHCKDSVLHFSVIGHYDEGGIDVLQSYRFFICLSLSTS